MVHRVRTQICQQGDVGSDLPCDPWAVPSILQSSFSPSVKWVVLMFSTSMFLLGDCLTGEDFRLLVILQNLGQDGNGQSPRINGDGPQGAILALPVLTWRKANPGCTPLPNSLACRQWVKIAGVRLSLPGKIS